MLTREVAEAVEQAVEELLDADDREAPLQLHDAILLGGLLLVVLVHVVRVLRVVLHEALESVPATQVRARVWWGRGRARGERWSEGGYEW